MWACRAFLCILALLSAGEAAAGAWPRGEGRAFLSLEGTVTTSRDTPFAQSCPIDAPDIDGLGCAPTARSGWQTTPPLFLPLDASAYGTLFFEYGWSERTTLGLDIGYDWDDGSWTALGLLRRSFPSEGRHVWAVELAAGPLRSWDGAPGTLVRPGLHWGFGADWGWLSAESYLVHRTDNDGMAYKLDLTAGRNRSDRVSWIFQVQGADYPQSDLTIRLAPSYVFEIKDGRRVKLGAVADVLGREDIGISLATWFDF